MSNDIDHEKSMKVKVELKAAQEIYDMLQPLSHKGRSRVMDWVIAKLEEERDEEATAKMMGGGPLQQK